MKRLDEGKVSLVEFLGSIKFDHQDDADRQAGVSTHFAHLDPQTRTEQPANGEESLLVRSAN